MGGGSKSTTTTATNTPWAPQGDQLQNIFQNASDLYYDNQGRYYEGPYTAGMNDTQRQALDQTLQAANAAGSFADWTTGQSQRLSGSYDAAKTITDGLASGDPIAAELARRAMEDPTAGILSTAGLYADNPYISGMIDNVGNDISRNLRENDLTSLNLGAAGAGNMNSSRAGAAEGILMRGAQDRLGAISSDIRGNAWNTGLAMAQQQRDAMFRNGLAASGQDINTKLQAAQNYASLGGVGTSLGAMGVENRANQAAFTGNVGNALQAEEQRKIGEAQAQFEGKENQDWSRLGNFYGIVGDKSWGGTQTQTAPKSGGSGLQTALGALATVGGVVAAPFTGGASLAVTAAGVGMMSQGMSSGSSGGGAAMPQMSYGGGGGSGYSGYQSGLSSAYGAANYAPANLNNLNGYTPRY